MGEKPRRTRASKAWYNALSPYYDVLVDPFQGRLRRRGIEELGVSPDDQALAVGCGTGREVARLQSDAGPGGRVVGIDAAAQMCHLTRERIRDETRSAVVCGDALALPFDTGSFDAVLVSFTLELFEDDHQNVVLEEIRRVLAPGGRICVIAPSAEASAIIGPLYKRLNDIFPTVVDSRPFEVSRVLAEAGFDIVQTRIEWAVLIPVEIVVARRAERT